MTLPEIAAEARRMADHYRNVAARWSAQPNLMSTLASHAAADFDRLAEMAERGAGNASALTGADRLAYVATLYANKP